MEVTGGSVVKTLPANAGDAGLIPGSDRSPGEGNSYPFQYSCLENPMDREAWWAIVHGVTKELDMTEHGHIKTLEYANINTVTKYVLYKNVVISV